MTGIGDAFRAFDHAGWMEDGVARAYHRYFFDLTRQAIPALLDAVGVGAGQRVLDVACGAGYVSAAARDRGAEAIGLDFSATQVRLAQELYPGIAFVEGDAETLPFAEGVFDAVVSNFGMPHFPDAHRVLRSAGRVLKPGGRFAYATWCGPEECVAFGMVEEAVQAHGTLDLGLPAGPDYARYADPDHARKLLAAAGFVTIESTRVPQVWRCPSPDSVFEAVSQATIVAAAVLEAQSDQARSRIKAFLRERTASFAKGDIYEVPMPALVAAGRKPG